MIYGVGTDIVEIERLKKIVERTPKMLQRVFTAEEIKYCEKKGNMMQSFAARFAAKEAILKAVGTGIVGFSWTDMDISNLKSGKPVVTLSGRMAKFAEKNGITKVEISFSHVEETAVAFAVACCE